MILPMFFSMFFINMFMPLIMIETPSHYYVSLNNIYGSLFMGSASVLAMNISMSLTLYTNILNTLLLLVSYLAIRNQWFVNDTFFLRDMIPHHSMALQTSSHILEKTKDSKIRELASTIYNAQVKEINYMTTLLQA